ncbi:MAG: hypothetical protein J6D44_06050 [Pseudomonas sp.]|nr:hypothetical protein [Pseudomonas sp.]
MALLDTLLLVFKADTSQADAGLDSARKKSDDLVDSLRNTDAVAAKTGASLKAMAAGALGGLAAAFSLGAAISGAFARADNIRAIEQTSDAIGAAIENVDAFGKAAEAMGGDAQGARDSLTDMAEKMGEAMSDVESGAAKAFKSLGISLKSADGSTKDAISGMLDLAGAVEGLDRSSAVFKIKELGITDNRTVEMILKGRQELERMLRVQKEQGVVSKEAAENARKLTEATGSLKNSMSNAGNSFLDSIIPALTKVIEWLGKGVSWMQDNKDFVIGFFGSIAAVVTALYLPAMASAAIATLAATWPLLLIGAAIAAAAAAFALIYDDIMNFVDGNESFIGQVFEKYPMVEKIVMTLIDAFRQMWQILITGAQQVGDFVTAGFQQVIAGIKAAVDYLSEAYGAITGFVDNSLASFQSLSDGISAIFAFIVETVKGSLSFVTAGIDKIKSGVSGVAGFFGFGDSSSAMQSASQQIGTASSAPSNGVSSSAISNMANSSSETNVQVGQVVVQTQATDAQGISRDVGSELQSQLKNLEHESATGVAR